MIERHVVYYLGSKVVAATLNLAAVAIFARLAGPAGYGEYLIAFAWAYIVYGFTIQWVRFSFFASYRAEAAAEQIATYNHTMWGALVIIALAAFATRALGLLPTHTILAVVSLVFGLALYDGAHEVSRSRLKAEAVAAAVVLRAVLMLAFGIAALKIYGTATALAVAVAIAHILAIVPLMRDIIPHLTGALSPGTARGFLRFGWPLILAFGVNSVGQNADRLLLANLSGVHVVGPYGAVNDLIKQCMVVLSEAIAGAYIAIAKRAAAEGDDARAHEVLEQAFRAYTAIAAFGSAFILRFERIAIDTLLGESFRVPTENLVPIFVAASVLMVYRSFYFGQVIFFVQSSMLELAASLALVVVVAVMSLLLVPKYMAMGAALALLGGQAVACAIYLVAGKRLYTMPVPFRDFLGIVGFAVVGFLATMVVEGHGFSPWVAVPVNLLLLTVCFGCAAYIWDLFSLNRLVGSLSARRAAAAATSDAR